MTTPEQNLTTIRAATGADAPQLSSLAHRLLLFERSLNEGMGELTRWAASPQELRKQMRRPNVRFFVAEKPGPGGLEIIGYVKIVIHGRQMARNELSGSRRFVDLIERTARRLFNFVFRRPRPNVEETAENAIGYIAGAFVRPQDRRTSVGRAMVSAAEEWLRAQGVRTSDLHVLSANESAWRFWEELGYKPLTMGMRKKLN
jgi:ribosomal protein S18 acetylase RimI-like enzyme